MTHSILQNRKDGIEFSHFDVSDEIMAWVTVLPKGSRWETIINLTYYTDGGILVGSMNSPLLDRETLDQTISRILTNPDLCREIIVGCGEKPYFAKL